MRFVSATMAAAAFLGLQATALANVRIEVDLASQTMHVTSADGADHDWAVSTGRPGYRTPTGVYHPQRMYVITHSAKYENAPMPHAIFFYGGYAIHGTYAVGSLGHVASHGCIRLAPGNAATLFSMVKREGATIVIEGKAPGRDEAVAESTHAHREAAVRRVRPAPEGYVPRDGEEPDRYAPGFHEEPLGYAPRRREEHSLRFWADNPIGNQ
jgi:hypothetical protein